MSLAHRHSIPHERDMAARQDYAEPPTQTKIDYCNTHGDNPATTHDETKHHLLRLRMQLARRCRTADSASVRPSCHGNHKGHSFYTFHDNALRLAMRSKKYERKTETKLEAECTESL